MVIGRVVQRIPVDGAWIRVFARSQDGDAVFVKFATLILHMQFLVCCIHRLVIGTFWNRGQHNRRDQKYPLLNRTFGTRAGLGCR
jgi:hypothetical protein